MQVGCGTLVFSVFLAVLPVQARTTTDRIVSGLDRISDDNGSRPLSDCGRHPVR